MTGRARDQGRRGAGAGVRGAAPEAAPAGLRDDRLAGRGGGLRAGRWPRLRRVADPASIRDLGAWLTTAVSLLALDALGSARARRERYVGPWLPEPLVEDLGGTDPADRVTLDESVSMALLVVLERLSPAERTVVPAARRVRDVVCRGGWRGRPVAAAVRQLAARARQHVDRGRPRFPPTRAQQEQLVTAFAAACAGDLEGLVALLDPGVVWRADGGGQVTATRRIARGADEVARWLLSFMRLPPTLVRMASVNGSPGLVVRDGGGVLTVVAFTVDRGRITALDAIRNPDKLTALPEAGPSGGRAFPAQTRPRRRRAASLVADLEGGELRQPPRPVLNPHAAPLHPAERQVGLQGEVVVHERGAAFQPLRDRGGPVGVGRSTPSRTRP